MSHLPTPVGLPLEVGLAEPVVAVAVRDFDADYYECGYCALHQHKALCEAHSCTGLIFLTKSQYLTFRLTGVHHVDQPSSTEKADDCTSAAPAQ